jgi:hypothetical protein
MDIPCFIYHNLLSIKEEQRNMKLTRFITKNMRNLPTQESMSNEQPRVRIQVSKETKENIKIVETEGRKKLLVKSIQSKWGTYISPWEVIHVMYICTGPIQVREADKLLKLECFPLESPPSSESGEFLMNPVGVSYIAYDYACHARGLNRRGISRTTVLMQPGLLLEKCYANYERLKKASPNQMKKPSVPYQIDAIEVYAEVSVQSQLLFEGTEDDIIEVTEETFLEGFFDSDSDSEEEEEDVNAPYFPPLTPLCYFGFSFLNDQGEWEPLMDFDVEVVSASAKDLRNFSLT